MAVQASVTPVSSWHVRRAGRILPGMAALAAPAVALLYLLAHPDRDTVIETYPIHFYAVTIVSVVGFVISGVVTFASARLREARAFFLNLGFLSISGIFFIHALATPGILMAESHPVVGLAARLSLLVGSIAFAMSAVRWSRAANVWIVRHWRTILVLLGVVWVTLSAIALFAPDRILPSDASYGEGYREEEEYGYGARSSGHEGMHTEAGLMTSSISVSSLMAMVAIALFGFAGARYFSEYRLAALPAQAALIVGIVLLAEAQLAMWLSAPWRLSWWGYHGLMLVGFIVSLVGFGLTYGRKRSLAGLLETLFLTDTIDRIESSYSEAIFALVAAVEARDQYTKGHSARVSQIAVLVGEALRLPGEQLRSLGRAGLVHDVGKLSVPDFILSKPGRLTEDEYATVKRHPLWGYEVIQKIESLRGDLPGVLHHHERYDGGGYPSGLAGEEIPLQARILSVADVFDALTSERPYRTAHTGGEALAYLRHMAGTQFDPAVVGALERVLDQWQERRRRLGM